MNNLVKKIIGFSVTTLMAGMVAISASAIEISGSSLGHKSDKWDYGVHSKWLIYDSQYSYFYCNNKYHTATAVMVVGNNRDEVRKSANKGKWAKAETSYYTSKNQWNSYYNHPNGL